MSAVLKPPKPKRCKQREPGCQGTYIPRNTLQPTCFNPKCAIAFAKSKEMAGHVRKLQRVEKREGREKLKRRKDYEDEAQRAFNAYIRARDEADPCICCDGWPEVRSRGRQHVWDAGHYRTVGAASHLRFNEDNCHKQLVSCNRSKSGNAVEYRKRLVRKIGIARVEALENDNSIVRRDIDELKAIRKKYQVKLRDLKHAREFGAAA